MSQPETAISSMTELISALSQATSAQRDMLRVLERIGRFATITEIAKASDLHPNSARESLDVLVGLGLVTKKTKASGTRGRPAWVYEASAPGSLQGVHNHICDFVTASVEMFILPAADPEQKAKELGERWGDQFMNRMAIPDHSRFQRLSSPDQLGIHASKIRVFLSGQGFVAVPGDSIETIEIRSCPFSVVSEETLEYIKIVQSAMLNRIVTVMSRGAVGIEFLNGNNCFGRVRLFLIEDRS